MSNGQSLIAINVGNTRTAVGQFVQGELKHVDRLPNADDIDPPVQLIIDRWREISEQPGAALVMASVNDPIANRLAAAVEDALTIEIYRVGDDVPVPVGQQLDRETITGVDRLLNAAAAFDRVKQACVVVDAGTAVTVDFIDGEGTFHGGAIAPGASMQMRSLHEHTAALPEVPFRAPEKEPFGRNTSQAMLQGVFHGIRGMVQRLVEQYAEAYGAFPLVVATGGDAATLFEKDELIDRIVPDLTLLGIATAAKHALTGDEGAERESSSASQDEDD